jgi:hypothetical protein
MVFLTLLLFLLPVVQSDSCFAVLYEADPLRNGLSFANGTYSTVYKGFFPYKIPEDIGFTGTGQGYLEIAGQGTWCSILRHIFLAGIF